MSESEFQRAHQLFRCMQKYDFKIESLRQPDSDYDAILVHSNSIIITGNQAAADIIGYSINELTGLNAWTLFPPESAPTIMQNLLKMSEEPYTVLARPRSGELLLIELQGLNLTFQDEPLRAVLFRPL